MTTDSRTLYATLLGLKAPWEITDVELKQPPGEVHHVQGVVVAFRDVVAFAEPAASDDHAVRALLERT